MEAFFGTVLEQYVYMLLEEMLGEPGVPAGRWFRPGDYERTKTGPEGPDAIIVDHEGGQLVGVFVEVKSSGVIYLTRTHSYGTLWL